MEAWDRQEEPLALADISGILAAVASLRLESLAGLGGLDLGGLEGFLGLADGADRGRFGNAGGEPVAFVVKLYPEMVPALCCRQRRFAGGVYLLKARTSAATNPMTPTMPPKTIPMMSKIILVSDRPTWVR